MDLERRADSTFRKENLPRCDDDSCDTRAMLLRGACRKTGFFGIPPSPLLPFGNFGLILPGFLLS